MQPATRAQASLLLILTTLALSLAAKKLLKSPGWARMNSPRDFWHWKNTVTLSRSEYSARTAEPPTPEPRAPVDLTTAGAFGEMPAPDHAIYNHPRAADISPNTNAKRLSNEEIVFQLSEMDRRISYMEGK